MSRWHPGVENGAEEFDDKWRRTGNSESDLYHRREVAESRALIIEPPQLIQLQEQLVRNSGRNGRENGPLCSSLDEWGNMGYNTETDAALFFSKGR